MIEIARTADGLTQLEKASMEHVASILEGWDGRMSANSI